MPIFNLSLIKLIDGFLFRFTHYMYYSELLLVLHFSLFVYIKSFKELSSFLLPFYRKSVCKGKEDFSIRQTFSKIFLKKFSVRTAVAVSRSLVRLQDKILLAAPAVHRISSLLAVSLESGCKGTHFFRFRKDMRGFF